MYRRRLPPAAKNHRVRTSRWVRVWIRTAKIDAARDVKVSAVKTAAASGVELAEAAQLLAAAEQKYAKDYQSALRADWTESDLRGFGLDAPGKKAGGRPRGGKTTRRSKTTDESNDNAMAGAITSDGQ